MTTPLLTIVVPTYNRASNLQLLLTTLQVELAGLDDRVCVLVSDNASTDGTQALTQGFQSHWPGLVVQRHAENVGADGNFASCVRRVESRYFWIIGDDDLPKRGVVAKVVALLLAESPALVYMQSEWVNPVTSADQGSPVGPLRVDMMGALDFARRVHVWFTFISGAVIDRSLLMREVGEETVQRYHGTSLIQLGWTLPFLKLPDARFAWIADACVLATKDNTGGYSVLKVFGENFPKIVRAELGADSTLARAIIRRCVVIYLPYLIWSLRLGRVGSFDAENLDATLRPQLGDRLGFWLLLRPIDRWPRPAAKMLLRACAVLSRFIGLHDRALARPFAREGLA